MVVGVAWAISFLIILNLDILGVIDADALFSGDYSAIGFNWQALLDAITGLFQQS